MHFVALRPIRGFIWGALVGESRVWHDLRREFRFVSGGIQRVRCRTLVSLLIVVLGAFSSAAMASALSAGELPLPGNPFDPSPGRPSEGCPPDKGCEQGYWLASQSGAVTGYGARRLPDAGPAPHGEPIVAMATNFSSDGYWLVSASGKVTTAGGAQHFGDLAGQPPDHPIVGIAPSGTYGGYWLAARDGTVYPFGDAEHLGNAPLRADQHIAAIVSVDQTKGYWLAAHDGAVFTFGDLTDHGSLAGKHLPAPIVAMTSCYDQGYWLLGRDGSMYAFDIGNDYKFQGSGAPAVGLAHGPGCSGFWAAFADGEVVPAGSARRLRSSSADKDPGRVVAIAL